MITQKRRVRQSVLPPTKEMTPEEWAKQQDEKQHRAAVLHEERRLQEIAELNRLNKHPRALTLAEKLDGVRNETPVPPDAYQDEEGVIHLKGRGPKTDSEGRYVSDGEVPTSKTKHSRGKVADAKRMAGDIARAQKQLNG